MTALITVAAIVLGYLTDSLPSYYLSPVDSDITRRFRGSGLVSLLTKWYERWNSCWLAFWVAGLSLLRIHKPKLRDSKQSLTDEERNDALVRFVLALSDQQLVTGLAILTGAYANWCTISNYEFQVVVSLAWFSSTTHLATLDVLQDYFRDHTVVRNWRVFGMLVLLVLLIFGNITSMLSIGWPINQPLACKALHASALVDESDFSPFEVMQLFVPNSYLVVVYTGRILNLSRHLNGENRQNSPLPRMVWIVQSRFMSAYHSLPSEAREELVRNAIAMSRTDDDRLLARLQQEKLAWKKRIFQLVHWQREYSKSYISNIPDLLFTFSYGVAQVVASRWLGAPKLAEEANRMGFGQIVPLLLLAIPVLIAAEIYYGEICSEETAIVTDIDQKQLGE